MESKKPLILVTNDDGITAKGIFSLQEAMLEFGDVVVVAPDSPQSGMGHAITINLPIRIDKTSVFEGIEDYTCTGTPVDCVKIGINKILKRRPDLIVSGINHGSNAASNVIYSGTMSAAVEGAIENIPSIGFSLLDFNHDADFEPAKKYVKILIEKALYNNFPENTCLNVNIPKRKENEIKGIKIGRQAAAFWDDRFEERLDPLGKKYYWLAGDFKNYDKGQDTDMHALENDYVSVVPTQFDMTAHSVISEVMSWF